MTWAIASDLVVVLTLGASIGYFAWLNRRLSTLRHHGESMGELIKGLITAAQHAEEGVRSLKLTTAESGQALQETIGRADGLRADLNFLIERAGAAADRLESALKTARDTDERNPIEIKAAPARTARIRAPDTTAEAVDPVPIELNLGRLARPAKRAGTSAASGTAAGVDRTQETADRPTRLPSRAERELRRALENRG